MACQRAGPESHTGRLGPFGGIHMAVTELLEKANGLSDTDKRALIEFLKTL